jgi:hypothetical protein
MATTRPNCACCDQPLTTRGATKFCSVDCSAAYRRQEGSKLSAYVLERSTEETDACIEWPFGCTKDGYGRVAYKGRLWLVHRLAYKIKHGKVDASKEVCHTCHNPPCFNARHLYEGTHSQNMNDMHESGRVARGSKHPKSKLTERMVRYAKHYRKCYGIRVSRLAEYYGVSEPLMSEALRGLVWKHVG